MTIDISVDDFMSGIIYGCALRHVRTFPYSTDEFYHAMNEAFAAARKYEQKDQQVELRFAIFLDELYGDSPIMDEAVNSAVQRRLLTLDPRDKIARLAVAEAEARSLLGHLPGSSQAYLAFADAFLSGLR